jgi:hypothetical protein
MSESNLHWQNPDWLKQTSEWIHAETTRRGIHITGKIEQPHIYPWSTVLRIPTNEGMMFFKATAPETMHESALTEMLAGWFPDCMPELLAVDTARGWMLMRDGGEPLRLSIRPTQDVSPWKSVIPLYSDLQVGLTERVSDLLTLGVPDWRLARLPELYRQLLTDTDSLRLDKPEGLTSAEFIQLKELGPRFDRICDELADFGIPESLNHLDFHDGNVLIGKDGRVTFFDWGDACVTHPFVSLRTFLVSIEIALKLEDYSFTPEMAAMLDLYLEPWQRFAPKENLLAAYKLSRCVAAIVKALAWYQTVSNLEGSLREQYTRIVPELLKEFLVYEKMLSN